MKLEAPAFTKFNLLDRISEVVKKSDFTAEELKNITSQKDLEASLGLPSHIDRML
jgi:hypothetical protein